MLDAVWLKSLVKAVLLPPASLLLVAAAGLALWRRRPRLGVAMTAFGVGSLFVLSMPIVAAVLTHAVWDGARLQEPGVHGAQAIVVLGGGVRPDASEYGGDTLGRLTLERVRYGARLARTTGLPVLVTGGWPRGAASTEAALMQAAFAQEYAIAVRWAEDRSVDTRSNARNSAPLLRAAGVSRVLLVAHAVDMRRARAEFAAAGIETVAAPTAIPVVAIDGVVSFWPSVGALEASYYALYEALGNLARLGRFEQT